MQSRKGQAAIEYLMNYSWAILVLAIVIGAMLFSGVFNPNYFVMEECYLGPAFKCHAQLIGNPASGAKLLINITNAHGYPVKIKNMTFSAENLGKSGATSTPLDFGNVRIENSASNVSGVTFPGPMQPEKGVAKKILMNLTYYICAEEVNPACDATPPFVETVSGRVVAQVN